MSLSNHTSGRGSRAGAGGKDSPVIRVGPEHSAAPVPADAKDLSNMGLESVCSCWCDGRNFFSDRTSSSCPCRRCTS